METDFVDQMKDDSVYKDSRKSTPLTNPLNNQFKVKIANSKVNLSYNIK